MTYDYFCPHCTSLFARTRHTSHPAAASRCPTCRLIVGPGRCRRATTDAGGSTAGSAAGVMVNAARRAGAPPGDPVTVRTDLVTVAALQGVAVERLRMTDYDAAQRRGLVATELAAVLATHGTWKAARTAAAADPHFPLEVTPRDGVGPGGVEHEQLG